MAGKCVGTPEIPCLPAKRAVSNKSSSDPEIAARTGAMSVREIAAEVGCDLATAARLRRVSWEFTAKYTHSEMPRAVALDAAVEGDGDNVFARLFAPAFAAELVARQARDEGDGPDPAAAPEAG